MVSDEHDLLRIEVDDGNEALRLHAHPALVDDQLVQRHAPVCYMRGPAMIMYNIMTHLVDLSKRHLFMYFSLSLF